MNYRLKCSKAKILNFLLILLFSTNLYAGTGTGKITGVLPYTKSNGEKLFFVKVEQKVDSPACNVTNRFVLSDTNPSFNTTVSAALAAYHAKSNVKIKGKGACNYWSNSEDVTYICFGDIAC